MALAVLGLAAFAVIATPFSYADGGSGRYLPNLLRLVDPQLFPADPVADAFGRFESVFYSGLGWLLGGLHVTPTNVEGVFYVLFALSKVALVALVFVLMRSLSQGYEATVILAAWAVHQKAAAVGGDSMFAPSLTHATVAVLLGMAALVLLVRRRPMAFWLVLACALFIHSLIALQLAMIAAPVIAWREHGRVSRSHLIGAGTFGLAFVAYWLWMTPPAFDAEEVQLFMASKGAMVHIAPQAQAALDWISMAGRVGLAWIAYRLFLARQTEFGYFAGFIVAGSLMALVFGLAATTSGNLQLAQLQPMRMFEWVNLCVFILLVCAVPKAWEADRSLGVMLLVVIALNILGSLWGLVWLYMAIASLVIRRTAITWSAIVLLTLVAVGVLLVGSSRVESLSEPAPVLMLVLVVAALWLGATKPSWRSAVVTVAVVTALQGRTVYVRGYAAERQNTDFELACQWIATNTSKGARFITAVTAKGAGNFRTRALRTSLNEGQSAVYWVAPRVARDNEQAAEQVQAAWDGHAWDMNTLWRLAGAWEATYILLEGGPAPAGALYQQGEYRVVEVPYR